MLCFQAERSPVLIRHTPSFFFATQEITCVKLDTRFCGKNFHFSARCFLGYYHRRCFVIICIEHKIMVIPQAVNQLLLIGCDVLPYWLCCSKIKSCSCYFFQVASWYQGTVYRRKPGCIDHHVMIENGLGRITCQVEIRMVGYIDKGGLSVVAA